MCINSIFTDPIFIVGAPRSGTTLTAAILDRHSKISVPPETHFYDWFLTDNLPPSATWEAMIDHFLLFKYASPNYLGVEREELMANLPEGPPNWSRLFHVMLGCYATLRHKTVLAEKTPQHWQHIPSILSDFPNAKFIWVTRDGRDTLLSRHNSWVGKDRAMVALHRQAWHWRLLVETMIRFEYNYPTKIFRLSFESLVANAEREVRKLCDFLCVAFEASQLDHRTPTGVVDVHELSWKSKVFEPIDKTRVGTWKQGFTDRQIWTLNSVMCSCHKSLGIHSKIGLEGCPLFLRIRLHAALWILMARSQWYRLIRPTIHALRKLKNYFCL